MADDRDALIATLPEEGWELRWATCAACEGKGYKWVAWSGGSFPTPTTFRDEKCWACHCTGLVVCRPALSPDSGADPEPPCCTGVAATWCPVHGDCTCPRAIDPDPDGAWWSENPTCPLHAMSSSHAEVEPQHSPLRTWPTDPETTP